MALPHGSRTGRQESENRSAGSTRKQLRSKSVTASSRIRWAGFDQEIRGRCGTGRCGGINRECEESRREALVAMVHTTDLGDGDDFSDLGHLYRPPLS